jgi:hypothetical protein
MVPIQVMGQVVLVYVTKDLSNNELQEHFVRAMEREDYEYCQALIAEADSRDIKLNMT